MSEKKEKQRRLKIKIIISIIKLIILMIMVIGMPLYVYLYFPELIDHFRSLETINEFLLQYKTLSIFVYVSLQIFQIVISLLPGQALQFAAGYAYTFWFGYLYSMIGIFLGTIITFYIARILGKDAMHVIFGEEKLSKFVHILNSKRALTILFVIFLIPGIPKDLFTYAAGISEIKIKPFLILSLIGRSPAMMGSIMMGSMFHKGSYTGLIILCIIAVITCIAGILKRDKLIKWSNKAYEKIANN